jgi:asparagine synthase (glutamine-hydrolysing)
MCGIAGIAGFEDKHDASERLGSMLKCLTHRGPDAEGIFADRNIALGQRRLSIIDLSEAANQPMFDAGGRYAVIQNGEIYNYREVRRELADYDFRTESDTEVILAAYDRFGPDCLNHLNGMFAIAIWDRALGELFLARDRIGVKPLYYAFLDGKLVFASEIRSILSNGLVRRDLDTGALTEYLMYQSVYSPRTIVRGVNQLPAGSYAKFKDGALTIEPYWRIDNKHEGDFSDPQKVKKRVRDLLSESIERRMIADVRLGAFLSGGIDSSVVVGLMAELSDQPVDTFSVNFKEKQFDESQYSDLIAKRFKTSHSTVELTANHFLDQLPDALAAVDAPSGDGLNTYIVSKATRQAGIKVALSGLGGDELFAGYDYFRSWKTIRESQAFLAPMMLRKSIGRLLSQTSNSKYHRVAQIVSVDSPKLDAVYPLFRQVMSKQLAGRYTNNSNGRNTIENELRLRRAETESFPLLSQVTIAELIGYTQSVLLKDTDQFSMASALEVREPFFDYKLVEYVLGIPDSIKFPTYPKKLLVESVAPLLPDEIVHRKKMGFVMPWQQWMRTELRDLCEVRLNFLAEREILDRAFVQNRWMAFQKGNKNILWSEFWHLIVLADWIDRNGF